MKKFLPFVFPFIALAIVLFLAVRWYNTKTAYNEDRIADFGDSIKIQDLSLTDKNKLGKTAKDVKTIELKGENASGEIRYEVRDGKLEFTVNADLPQLEKGIYQVWLKEVNGNGKKKAFVLEDTKGGFSGSAAIDKNVPAFEVVVTREMYNDEVMETVVLSGMVPAENTR
jgi:hypothetical protein